MWDLCCERGGDGAGGGGGCGHLRCEGVWSRVVVNVSVSVKKMVSVTCVDV